MRREAEGRAEKAVEKARKKCKKHVLLYFLSCSAAIASVITESS